MKKRTIIHKKTILMFLGCLVLLSLPGCGLVDLQAINHKTEGDESADMQPISIVHEEAELTRIASEELLTMDHNSYANDTYGFQFDFPLSWTLTEEEHGISIFKENYRLLIQFGWVGESTNFGSGGVGAGEFVEKDDIQFFDHAVKTTAVIYEDKTKSIIWHQATDNGMSDLDFLIILDSIEVDYDMIDLSEEAINEAIALLETFQRIPLASEPGFDEAHAADSTMGRTEEEAVELISGFLLEQNSSLMEAPYLMVQEVAEEKVSQQLQVQVFRVTEGTFQGESFLLWHDHVVQLGIALGGKGLTSMLAADLNQDNRAEFYFSYIAALSPSMGTDTQTRVGVVDFTKSAPILIEADMAFLGDAALREDEPGSIILSVIELTEPFPTGLVYREDLGRMSYVENTGKISLVLNISPDLKAELRNQILPRQ